MSDKNFYVLGDDNCKYEGMSKEQIIATIQEAISTGTIPELDAGVITKIKEQNKQRALSFWVGSQAEYNAIQKKADNCFYIINNSGNFAELKQKVDDNSKALQGLTNNVEEIVKKSFTIVEEYHGPRTHYFKFGNGLEIEFGYLELFYGTKFIDADVDVDVYDIDGGEYQRKVIRFPFYKAQKITSVSVTTDDGNISPQTPHLQAVRVAVNDQKEVEIYIEPNGGIFDISTLFEEWTLRISYTAFGFDYGK